MTKGLSEADASAVIDAVYSGFVGEGTYDADLAVDQVIALIESGIGRIQAEALRDARDNYRPGDNNPWALNVRKFLDYRANMIEGGE